MPRWRNRLAPPAAMAAEDNRKWRPSRIPAPQSRAPWRLGNRPVRCRPAASIRLGRGIMTDTTAKSRSTDPGRTARMAMRGSTLTRVVLPVCPVDRGLDRTSDGVPARGGGHYRLDRHRADLPLQRYVAAGDHIPAPPSSPSSMVFLIQNTQNRDMLTVQLKLSQLVLATSGRAKNKFAAARIGPQRRTWKLEELHNECRARAES